MGKSVTRLFTQFQPEHYVLALDIDRDNIAFSGTVQVRGKKVGRPSERLTFHQKGLKITSATITKVDKKGDHEIAVKRINNQDSFDEVRLHADGMIYPGEYVVTMEFEAIITRHMNGIYPCYFTHDGQEKQLIATQFESHHAREAFPCIDEPEAKATFDLTLVSPAGEEVLSNTPVKEQQVEGKKQVTSFETTPRMSVYLLAFVFGELEHLEATTKDGVVVRTYATPDNIKFTQFALDCAVKTLEFYNEYFDVPYPLAKCDFIALPDFASGAMENWGAITFREQALLVDPKNTSLHLTQYVANVVAHELTHQWFGNLVTMRWWTDLWLNESFASWMSYLAVDHLFPEWKVWTQFIVDEQGLALKLDALEHTHPIQVEVKHPDEIRTIFDAISYEKGASVLLMLHDYLGDRDFRDGLRIYLKRHAYGNTDGTDLWAAWEEASKKPVTKFMNAWLTQSGYPIVHANTDSLSQERFYLNPAANKEKTVWPIPLLSESLGLDTLEKAETKLGKATPDYLLNHSRTSFFRAIYQPEHLAKLADQVRTGKLNELDRLGLLGDAFEAAKAGYGPTVDALKLLDAYEDEDSTVVWDVIAGSIGSLRVVMDDDAVRKGLKSYVHQLSAKQLKRLGWDERKSDSHFDKLLRPSILGLASYGEDPAVLKEARQRFDSMKQPEDIHPDLRGVVYGTIARTGTVADFDKMIEMHNTSQNSEDRVTLAGALTGFEQPALIKRALQQIISDDVRLQDVPYWIAYSFMNRHARLATWQWLQDNWDWLAGNLGTDLSFYRTPIYAARGFSDASFVKEFKAFFESKNSPALERSIKQGIETIQWQAAWKIRDLAEVRKYLK
ncbi:MAG TPA: M1 family metallopeptidase [Candidatus Saccharimonadales bacterium]|nr:M1 family metallopeptidase [Candidatus Saccharimonadales bacterium]